MTSICKGGDRRKPKNYRPVTLTSHILKLFEKILVKNYLRFEKEMDCLIKINIIFVKGDPAFRNYLITTKE